MPKIAINLLGWRSKFEVVSKAIDAVLAQEYQDFIFYYSENDSIANTILPEVRAKYGSNPKVRIVDNRENLGYAGGHNKFFASADTELVMVLNPDAELDPGFLKNIIPLFDDPQVGMATGKMLKPVLDNGARIIDGTGIIVYKSRRGRERGQMEIDHGQYDQEKNIFGVSGTAGVYRRSALEKVKTSENEYFDPDFFAYWEDLDLSWRLRLAGYVAKYEPCAILYHERVAGNHKGGYKDFFGFVKHHSKLSVNVRRWNWRNHLFCIIKNDFGYPFYRDFPRILAREIIMAGYITIFEPRTWGGLPTFFKLLPKIRAKRKIIQAARAVGPEQAKDWFV